MDNFSSVAVDINQVKYENSTKYMIHKKPTLYDYNSNIYRRYTRLSDMVEIGNGMVSGLDKAFKIRGVPHETDFAITVVKARNLMQYYNKDITWYYFLNDIDSSLTLANKYPKIYEHLLPFKEKLEKRYDYNRDIPWWHWVFLRNKELMESSDEKIFIPCKERFDKRKYFRFAYVKGDKYATQDMTVLVKKSNIKEDLKYILGWLNSSVVYEWITRKSLIRGGIAEFSERPLSNIPIRFINWDNPSEVRIHDNIVDSVNEIIANENASKKLKEKIEGNVKKLVNLN